MKYVIVILVLLVVAGVSAGSVYEAQKEMGAETAMVVLYAYHDWCDSCSLRWATRLDQPHAWYKKEIVVQGCPTYTSPYRDQNYSYSARALWRCEEESLSLDTGRVRTRWLMNAECNDSLSVWESARGRECDTLYRNRCGDWVCATFYVEPLTTWELGVVLAQILWRERGDK